MSDPIDRPEVQARRAADELIEDLAWQLCNMTGRNLEWCRTNARELVDVMSKPEHAAALAALQPQPAEGVDVAASASETERADGVGAPTAPPTERLRRLAEDADGAFGSDWRWDMVLPDAAGLYGVTSPYGTVMAGGCEETATFVAACNPQAVMALLNQLDDAKQMNHVAYLYAQKLEADLAELRAAVLQPEHTAVIEPCGANSGEHYRVVGPYTCTLPKGHGGDHIHQVAYASWAALRVSEQPTIEEAP